MLKGFNGSSASRDDDVQGLRVGGGEWCIADRKEWLLGLQMKRIDKKLHDGMGVAFDGTCLDLG